MRPSKLLLYITGEAPPEVAAAHGDKTSWYQRIVDAWSTAADRPVMLEPYDATTGYLPPGLTLAAAKNDDGGRGYDGVIVTGSRSSLTAPEPWMEAGVELVRFAFARRMPLLGVCFGHQLIGAAFGGSVVKNPCGWEVSTRAVQITARGRGDAIFEGLPDVFDVNFSHRDIVDHTTLSPVNGVEILAENDKAPVQAVAAGPSVRGVQFHPEFNGAVTAALIRGQRDELASDALSRGAEHEHPDTLSEGARDCPVAEGILHNFLACFVAGGRR